ncbi:hypothetical protein KGQ20_12535 [Catenulispora sp. NF23]|uniref:hypothetical protein n=1 Tax=Catenulispora pinistramenti TaxID=2705254 RepID=UPI001BAA48EF|nr:hypothetical protein [Catenulispora pinistramenti]MBS2533597.1 hypothetical protein [Catenulispora pinistramenti]
MASVRNGFAAELRGSLVGGRLLDVEFIVASPSVGFAEFIAGDADPDRRFVRL